LEALGGVGISYDIVAKELYRYVVRRIYGTGLNRYSMQGMVELEESRDMYHGLGERNNIGYSVLCERIVDFAGIAEEGS